MSFNLRLKNMTDEVVPMPEKTFAKRMILSQPFSYPNPMMNYIKKNPSTPKIYINLLKSCKYFYSKKVLIIPLDSYDRRVLWEKIKSKKDLSNYKFPFNIWFTDVVNLMCEIPSNRNFSCDSYFYKFATRFFLKAIRIYCQSITFEELKLFTINGVKDLDYRCTTVLYSNGTVVPVEEIFAIFKKIKNIFFTFSEANAKLVTAETAKNLAQIIDTSKLERFYLNWIPKNFDFKAFKKFTDAHKNIYFKVEKIPANVRYWY